LFKSDRIDWLGLLLLIALLLAMGAYVALFRSKLHKAASPPFDQPRAIAMKLQNSDEPVDGAHRT
jgi:hypothetical protein